MGFLKCTITFIFRALFVTALLGLGVKNFLDINRNIPRVQNTLKLAGTRLPKHSLVDQTLQKANTLVFELMNFHCGLLLLTSLLALFRFRFAKFTMFVYVLLELALKNNYFLTKDEQFIHNGLKYISLFASVLYI